MRIAQNTMNFVKLRCWFRMLLEFDRSFNQTYFRVSFPDTIISLVSINISQMSQYQTSVSHIFSVQHGGYTIKDS
jgi:hypothetical protein